MPKCVYCGKNYDFPRGLTLVMNDGTIRRFCSSKCRKNSLMKRRNIRWIKKSKKEVSGEIKEEKEKIPAPEKEKEEKTEKSDVKEENK